MRQITPDPTDVAPSSSPLSAAIESNGHVYTSGQIARRPDGEVVTGSIAEQTRVVLENLEAVLDAAGTSLEKAVKATVFLTDIDHFEEFNSAYRETVPEPYPARSAVVVDDLAMGVDVEIEMIAEV